MDVVFIHFDFTDSLGQPLRKMTAMVTRAQTNEDELRILCYGGVQITANKPVKTIFFLTVPS